MAFLDLSDVRKNYGPNTVVHKFDLDVERGEFISFLGPWGCGKTTTLRMVAGFEVPSGVRILPSFLKSMPSGALRKASCSGVSIPPGATQFTRTPRSRYSSASARVSCTTPPFDAQ